MAGQQRYISSDVYIDSFSHVSFGSDCVVSKNVTFLTHDYSLTTALVAANKRPKTDVQIQGKINIGSNVFIGLGTTILPGTTIGDNVIIGARSVVKGKIPSNVVAAGNPCKPIAALDEYLAKKEKQLKDLDVRYD